MEKYAIYNQNVHTLAVKMSLVNLLTHYFIRISIVIMLKEVSKTLCNVKASMWVTVWVILDFRNARFACFCCVIS